VDKFSVDLWNWEFFFNFDAAALILKEIMRWPSRQWFMLQEKWLIEEFK